MSLHPTPIDLETTGLHPTQDLILEFAMLVCDRDLNVVADFGSRTIRQSNLMMKLRMNDYVSEMHFNSGLLEAVMMSELKLEDVDAEAAQFLRDLGYAESDDARDRDLILLGSSCRLDRYMIELQMPQLNRFLHYRMIDASGIREAAAMWAPDFLEQSTYNPDRLLDEPGHRAHADARRSLEEAREQRSAFRNSEAQFSAMR